MEQENPDAALPAYAKLEIPAPAAVAALVADITAVVADDALKQQLAAFQQRWAETFARFGPHYRGELAYRDLLLFFQEHIAVKLRKPLAAEATGRAAVAALSAILRFDAPVPRRLNLQRLARARRQAESRAAACPVFERPLFIVCAPRAGSTLLFETLVRFAGVWSLGDENHEIFESIPALHPAAKDFASNRLIAEDATPVTVQALQEKFTGALQDHEGRPYAETPARIRFLEKTPKNALRIPFLKAAFPDALFLWLYREPRENIASMMEGWRSRRFIAYRDPPGWPYREWSFLLPAGWRDFAAAPIADIAAFQWQAANAAIHADLQTLAAADWRFLHYRDLIAKPLVSVRQISEFAGWTWDEAVEARIADGLPVSNKTLSAPAADKWRRHEAVIHAAMANTPAIAQLMADVASIEQRLIL